MLLCLQGEDLSAAYASADIFAMPSESETLGFVVLEAMASSLPVVAVRAGGIPDIITPDQNGEHNPNQLVSCNGPCTQRFLAEAEYSN